MSKHGLEPGHFKKCKRCRLSHTSVDFLLWKSTWWRNKMNCCQVFLQTPCTTTGWRVKARREVPAMQVRSWLIIKSQAQTKCQSSRRHKENATLPDSFYNGLLVSKQVSRVGSPSWYAGLRGNTGYCRRLWREHTGIWCKRFWHRTTEQLYWQVLQLTAYRTHYTSILLTAATKEGLQRVKGYSPIMRLSTLWSCHNIICQWPSHSMKTSF